MDYSSPTASSLSSERIILNIIKIVIIIILLISRLYRKRLFSGAFWIISGSGDIFQKLDSYLARIGFGAVPAIFETIPAPFATKNLFVTYDNNIWLRYTHDIQNKNSNFAFLRYINVIFEFMKKFFKHFWPLNSIRW